MTRGESARIDSYLAKTAIGFCERHIYNGGPIHLIVM